MFILGIGFVFVFIGLFSFYVWLKSENQNRIFVRGGKLIAQREAERIASDLCDEKPSAQVGPLRLPIDLLTKGILLLGAPGSGKGITIALFLASVAKLIAMGQKLRLIVWDPRGEFYVLLNKMLPTSAHLISISPVDIRGRSWSLAKDFVTEGDADELAELLIAEESRRDNPYFPATGRLIVSGVIQNLQKTMPDWNLRHVLLICSDRRRLMRFLAKSRATRHLTRLHLKKGRTANDVLSTIGSYLGRFKIAAAGWACAKDSFSIKEFMSGHGETLILPFSHTQEAVFNPINALIMKRITQEILQRNDPSIPTIAVFDEFRMMKKIDIGRLLLMGRGAGAIPLLAFQDISGLEEVLNKSKAQEILSLLQIQLLFRTEGIVSPQFESDTIGDEEVIDFPPIDRTAKNARIDKRRLVTPDEFRDLPLAGWDRDRIEAYMKAVGIGSFRASYGFRKALDSYEFFPTIAALIERPANELELSPLTKVERDRLGL